FVYVALGVYQVVVKAGEKLPPSGLSIRHVYLRFEEGEGLMVRDDGDSSTDKFFLPLYNRVQDGDELVLPSVVVRLSGSQLFRQESCRSGLGPFGSLPVERTD